MKILTLPAVILMAASAFASTVNIATQEWVLKKLAEIEGKPPTANVVTNANGTFTISAPFTCDEVPSCTAISFTVSRGQIVTNAPSLSRKLLRAVQETSVSITLTIQSGEWYSTDAAGHMYPHSFNLGPRGWPITATQKLPAIPSSEHVCTYDAGDCHCNGTKVNPNDIEVPDEYNAWDYRKMASELGGWENWIDPANLPAWVETRTVRGQKQYYIKDNDGISFNLNNIEQSDAWASAIKKCVDETINPLLEACRVAHKLSQICTLPFEHRQIRTTAGSAAKGCQKCDWCNQDIRHDMVENSCHCFCNKVKNHIRNPETCRCFCKEMHFPMPTSCPNICGICKEAISGQTNDPENHKPRLDGSCGCECGYFSSARPSTDEKFHAEGEDCICPCGHYHRATESDCHNVCGSCQIHTMDTQVKLATENDHTPNTSADRRCGCKCKYYDANNTADPRFHIRMPNSCLCYGSNGRGGKFHFHDPDPDCKRICRYELQAGQKHLANQGTEPAQEPITPALPIHHDKTGEMRCGCRCRYLNNNSPAPDLEGFHNHKDGTCACWCTKYAATAADDDTWHNWSEGNCRCDCTLKHHFTGGGACPAICSVCREINAAEKPAEAHDHTPKSNACGCLCDRITPDTMDPYFHNGEGLVKCWCSCNRIHARYNGSPATCQVCTTCMLTAGGMVPDLEELHKLNPAVGDKCTCFCGFYASDNRTAKSESLHNVLPTSEHGAQCCYCLCGIERIHFFREGNPCPGICKYCQQRNVFGVTVNAEDHTPFEDHETKTRCGCKCGGALDKLNYLTDRFHYRKPGSCRCLGSDGNGGSHHFRSPRSDCPGICDGLIDGYTHKVADYDHQKIELSAIRDDGRYIALTWHTGRTEGGCGCECGRYGSGNVNDWNRYMPNWHVNDPFACGCYCRSNYGLNQDDWHYVAPGDCHCNCLKKVHQPPATDVCMAICPVCKGKFAGPYTGTPAPATLHTPSADHCGCECGDFPGTADEYKEMPAFHKTHLDRCWEICDCDTIQRHVAYDPNACGICRSCGYMRNKEERVEHDFDHETRCVCKCGEEFRGHDPRLESQQTMDSHQCEICLETFNTIDFVYACTRCGFSWDEMVQCGKHGPHKDDEYHETDPYCDKCNCNCKVYWGNGHYGLCKACKNDYGTCETCGRSCGGQPAPEGGGGGESGEDENNRNPLEVE